MCKFKLDPYNGNSSDGFPAKDYVKYVRDMHRVQAKSCEEYEEKAI